MIVTSKIKKKNETEQKLLTLNLFDQLLAELHYVTYLLHIKL